MVNSDTKLTAYQKLDRAIWALLLCLAVSSPFFILPLVPTISILAAKKMLVFLVVPLAMSLWALARLLERRLSFSAIWFLLPIGILVFGAILSAWLGPSFFSSFWGLAEDETVFLLLIFLAVFFLAAQVFNSPRRIYWLLGAIIIGFFITVLAQAALAIFGSDAPTVNAITGQWVDLAILAGLVAGLSLTVLIFRPADSRRALGRILIGLFGLALALMFVLNFDRVLILIGLWSAVLFLVSYLSFNRWLWPLAVVLVVSLALLVNQNLGWLDTTSQALTQKLSLQASAVYPSWSMLSPVAKIAIAENAILGLGPNNFAAGWRLARPEATITSAFWNTDFSQGPSLMVNWFINGGVLAVLGWLVFWSLLVWYSQKLLGRRGAREDFSRWLLSLTLVAAVFFLWLMLIIYVPSVATIILCFLLTGALVGWASHEQAAKKVKVRIASRLTTGALAGLGLVLVVLLSTFSFYRSEMIIISSHHFKLAQAESSQASTAATRHLREAAQFHGADLYYRALAEIARQGISAEAPMAEIEERIKIAIDAALQATAADGGNYWNWLTRGAVYESLFGLGVEGAEQSALASYDRAKELNPRNPVPLFHLARLRFALADVAGARRDLEQALKIKNDYTPAIIGLAEIEAGEGEYDKARERLTKALELLGQNQDLLLERALVNFAGRAGQAAEQDLLAILAGDENHLAARILLGRIYRERGEVERALTEFRRALTLAPNQKELINLISELEGKLVE